jgi:uncharacterized protein (TIGR01244 family)
MEIRQITSQFAVSPQISPEDMLLISEAGFKRVLCNRPDSEVPFSHQAATMEKAAIDAGLEFIVIPLTHQSMTPDTIARNHEAIDSSSGPVLAYCASGTRSTFAWALGAAKELGVENVTDRAAQAGYDLTSLRPALMASSAS